MLILFWKKQRSMKLSVLALDYDGTIAIDGVLGQSIREAIGDVRRHGIAVVLVTGRRLEDLQRVAGDLSCFDAIVGENGAVLDFPLSGRRVLLGHAANDAVAAELRRRNVDIAVGQSVIEADASAAATVLDVIRAMEQPLIIAFNRGRMMVLPQAVAKSTGLRQALFSLRLSIHNAVGIGDAENDHDLLDACEVGVAVNWGSPALRAVADDVIPGTGPDDVAAYIRRLATQPRLSPQQMGRRRLMLGHQHNGDAVSLAVRGRTILIAGEPGTGKSWLAGLICEQLILQGYCLCIIDPEGDYCSLEALPNVITLGGADPPPHARELLRALRHPDVSVVVDLSKLSYGEKTEYLRTLLPLLSAIRRQTGLPHKILLDEAHYFLSGSSGIPAMDAESGGNILITYKISSLDPAIRAVSDAVVMVTRETDPLELETFRALCRPCAGVSGTDVFTELATNEAALLPGVEEARGDVRRFILSPRLTAHVRHQAKYLDMPVPEDQAFVFSDGRGPRAATLKSLVESLSTLPGPRVEGHLRRHDFSRWIEDIFRDRTLAARVRTLEANIGRESTTQIVQSIVQTIRARYEPALLVQTAAAG